jgi:predicted P-loop ATPase
MIRHVIAKRFSFHPHVGDMYDAITARSREHMFNPVVDWLDSLKWDGQPRLDRWMIEHLGADDSPYVRAVSRKAITAAVRRAKHPGCKFDHMLILCGPQDIGKSFCIADCAGVPELFSDADLLTKSGKEQLEAVEGKWFYEIAECDGMDKVAVTKTKAFITRQFDRARKAYGRSRAEVPRTCVFIGTSNDRELFRDPTGERRFWPVIVTKYDRMAFLENREQIFAEAVARETAENLWLDDADLRAEHAKKIDSLRARDGIEDWVACVRGAVGQDDEERVSSAQVFLALSLQARDLTDKTTKRVAVAMRRCGWVGPQSVRITGDDGKTFVASGYKRTKEAREAFRASQMPEGDSADNAPVGPIPDPGPAEPTVEDVGETSTDAELARAIDDLLKPGDGVRPECPNPHSTKMGGGDSFPRN